MCKLAETIPPIATIAITLASLTLNCSGSSGNAGPSQCRRGDLRALLRFKAGIIFDNSGRLRSWNDFNCCQWQEVSCNNQTGRVVELRLSGLLSEEEVSAMIRSIWEESESGRIAVNVTEAISSSLANILWRILARKKFFDKDLGADGKGFTDLVLEVSAAVGSLNIGDFIPYLDWLDLQGIKRSLKKANTRYDALAEKMIDEHVNARAATNGQAEAESRVKDFIDVLLEMAETDKMEAKVKRETIKAVTYDLFSAGMETSANALEWAMSELLRHPHAMKRLQEEIESVVGQHGIVNESDLGSMVYLQCVVKETLRLYPSLPLALPHASVEAVTVGGYYIPKKTMVILNVWALGRDPMVWGADTSEFKPERFMQVEEHGTDLSGGQSDFRMLPFGAGRRSCPGSAMAILTVQFTLAQLLNTFDWRVEGDPSELDMKEACATTMPRQAPLFAYPSLKRPLSL